MSPVLMIVAMLMEFEKDRPLLLSKGHILTLQEYSYHVLEEKPVVCSH